jgi:hypothetical protein
MASWPIFSVLLFPVTDPAKQPVWRRDQLGCRSATRGKDHPGDLPPRVICDMRREESSVTRNQINVLVTGMGMTTPLGPDVASTWRALLAGESRASSPLSLLNSAPVT